MRTKNCRTPLFILALLASAWLPAVGCRPSGSTANAVPTQPSARVLAEGWRIFDNCRQNTYSHKSVVDETAGRYELDCSGLIGLILKNSAPSHMTAARRDSGRVSPRAMEYQAFFVGLPADDTGRDGWRRVTSLVDAYGGDIIAWRRDPPEENNTGHVVLLLTRPTRGPDGLWRADILDSTSSPHAEDTRPAGTSGVGRGVMWFRADASGRPVAFFWSRPSGRGTAAPISIGRAIAR